MNAPLPPTPKTAQFSGCVIAHDSVQIRLPQLEIALRSIAPQARLGDWSGSFSAPVTEANGIDMLSVDGVPLTLLPVNTALPPDYLSPGGMPNYIMTIDMSRRLLANKAHVMVMPARAPASLADKIATARAVTLLAWAVAKLVKAEAFKWTDANQVVPLNILELRAEELLPRRGTAIPAWVRLLAGVTPPDAQGRRMTRVGSYGLWAFGLPEIEYEPLALGTDYLFPHAWGVCTYLLTSGKRVSDGDTIDIDGKIVFRAMRVARGDLSGRPTLMFSRT